MNLKKGEVRIPILGIAGVARSGKDTFYSFIPPSIKAKRLAFADALKEECDAFLKENVKISSFTTNVDEKEIIRPFLVTYGTHLRRKLNPFCWISKIEKKATMLIEEGVIPVVTDVRYKNEADWIHKMGGKLIHITRTKGDERSTYIIPPSNIEEEENNPILMENADELLTWPTPLNLESCKPMVVKCLKNLQIIN